LFFFFFATPLLTYISTIEDYESQNFDEIKR